MRNHAEHNIQCSIIQFLRWHGLFCFAIPNGDKRDARTGARLKKEGVLAGIPDIQIVLKDKVYFVEVKTEAGKLSPSQKIVKEQLENLGHVYLVWRSIDDAERDFKFFKMNK